MVVTRPKVIVRRAAKAWAVPAVREVPEVPEVKAVVLCHR